MKNKNLMLLALALAVCLVGVMYYGITFNDVGLPTDDGANDNGGNQGSTTDPTGMTSVNKPLKIVGVDELAGGSLDGTTNAVVVYDSDGKTVLETGSFSSGAVTTGQSYPSGKQLWIKYYYDTTIDSYMFWQVTVPKMTPADAESLTSNQITLKTREAGAYTDSLITSSGLTIADGTDLNTTGSGNDTLTATYTFYTTTDNTGYPTFTDPIYNMQMKIQIWATLSGTGYEAISLSGFDGGFEKGSTMYYYKTVNPNDAAKYKVGNDYVYAGSGSVSFGWNAAGYSNATTAYATLQIYLKIYSNEGYLQQYGDYGPYDFTAAEQTMDFMYI
jgi:hypothetical protein